MSSYGRGANQVGRRSSPIPLSLNKPYSPPPPPPISSRLNLPPSALASGSSGTKTGGQQLHVRFALTPLSPSNSSISTSTTKCNYEISDNDGRQRQKINGSSGKVRPTDLPQRLYQPEYESLEKRNLPLFEDYEERKQQSDYANHSSIPQEREHVSKHRRRYQSESSAGKRGEGESITGMLNNFSKALGKSIHQATLV